MEEEDDLKIYSEEVRDVLSEPPRALFRWGNTMLFGFIILLLLLAYFIKYPDIIAAPITITTQIPPEKIMARNTGAIKTIFVGDRTEVEENTPLAIIENTADYRDVFKLKGIIDTLKTSSKNFTFPIQKTYFMQLGAVENAFTLFKKAYLAYRLNKDLTPYKIERNAQRSEIQQLRERLKLMQQQESIGQTELELQQKNIERFKKLYKKGIIAEQEWEIEKLSFLQNKKALKNLGLQILQSRSAIIDLNRNRKTTTINKKMDKVNLLRNTLQAFKQLKEAIHSWEMNFLLRSSIAGKVSFLQIWSENQIVASGETIFTIVPKEAENYIGKVLASARNSGKLERGQPVHIRLAGYPYREFGVLEGKVQSISLTPNPEGFYLIDVSLPEKLITNYGKTIDFQQEMIGTANIITEDLRLIERLFYQLREVFKR